MTTDIIAQPLPNAFCPCCNQSLYGGQTITDPITGIQSLTRICNGSQCNIRYHDQFDVRNNSVIKISITTPKYRVIIYPGLFISVFKNIPNTGGKVKPDIPYFDIEPYLNDIPAFEVKISTFMTFS